MITFKKLGDYGRLGNQMFQIAATVSHSLKMNETYGIKKWKYDIYFDSHFNYVLDNNLIYKEPFFHYKEIKGKNIDLNGYFQSEKYFIQFEDEIRKLYNPKKEIISELRKKYGDLLKNSISIHIRRTDYVEKQNYHPLQTIDYYNESINYIKKRKHIENILVFSDDINWCKNNMSNEYDYIQNSEIEDMFLMSLCENNIIANSSFSWWASWLNQNTNKIIIAPKKWFGVNINTKDLYRKEMIIL